MVEWREHETRAELIAELHARPRPQIPSPAAVARIDLVVTHEEARAHVERLRARLAERGAPIPEADARHHTYSDGTLTIAFERHTEFISYTVIDADPGDEDPFSSDILDKAGEGAFDDLPGKRISAIRLQLMHSSDGALNRDLCAAAFGGAGFTASSIRGGSASIAADFRPDHDGFMRFLVFDSNGNDAVRGRMVQRILEMEAYRMAAMLALPLAREAGGRMDAIETMLDEVSDRISAGPHAAKDRDILQRLTRLAGEVERLRARGDYRFAAARAYGGIVADRMERLRPGRIEGHERVGVFIRRRLDPALKTCEAVAARQRAVAERINRAVRLLATRVQVDVEEQNASLLDAMNRRAAAQLKLQETVEYLSAVAITYYAVSLIYYLARGAEAAGAPINVYLITAASAPIVFITVVLGVRSVRHWLRSRNADRDKRE